MKKLAVIGLSLAFALNLSAQTAKPESVSKMLEVSGAQQTLSTAYGQFGQMFDGMAAQLGMTDAEKPILKKFTDKMEAMLKQEAGWDKLKAPIAEIYAKKFTDEEIQEMIKFYESPAGKAFAAKMPEVNMETAQVTQKIMMDLVPKIQTLAGELSAEIQKARAGK